MKILIFTLLLSFSLPLAAFDALGHRIVADIAYANLKCNTRNKVDKILGKHGIIYTAIWTDDIRSDEKYAYSYNWHYQNLRDGMKKTDLQYLYQHPTAEGEHLFFALDSLTRRLRYNKSDAEALKFIVHFSADLFQPMHLGRAADRGGNDVTIKWFGRDIRLHQLWDTQMLEGQKFSYSEYSRYLQDKFARQKKEIKKQSRLDAIWATYLLRNKIYAYDYTDLKAYNYIYKFNDDLDIQLYRAGIQLASLLNEIY
ncbi:MAG: S1/P1 nuclease [Paludibacteraceae bacterium]